MSEDQSCNSFPGCLCLGGPVHEVVVGALVREGRVLLVHRRPTCAAPEEHDGMEWFGLGGLPPPPHLLARNAIVEAMHDLRD